MKHLEKLVSFILLVFGMEQNFADGDLDDREKLLKEMNDRFSKQVEDFKKGVITEDQHEAELKKISNEVNEKFDTELKKELADAIQKVNKELSDEFNSQMTEKQAQIDAMKSVIEEQGKAITDKENAKGHVAKSNYWIDVIEANLIKEGKLVETGKDPLGRPEYEFKKAKGANFEKFNIDTPRDLSFNPVRKADEMSTSATFGTDLNDISVTRAKRDAELAMYKDQNVMDWFLTDMTRTEFYEVLVEYDEVDNAGTRAETESALVSKFEVKLNKFEMFSIGAKVRVTEETLLIWSKIKQRLQSIIPDRINNQINSKVLGTNTTITTDIAGLRNTTYSYQLDFASTDAALIASAAITDPSKVDVIAYGLLKITNLKEECNAIFMNDVDITSIEGLKDGNGNSVKDNRITLDNKGKLSFVSGLRVLKNNNVPAGQALLVNLDDTILATNGGIEMRMNYDLDGDFGKAIVTFRFNVRVTTAPVNKTNLWIASFADQITAIEAAS